MFGIGKLRDELKALGARIEAVEAAITARVVAQVEAAWAERVEARLEDVLARLGSTPESRDAFLLATVSQDVRGRVQEALASITKQRTEAERMVEELRRLHALTGADAQHAPREMKEANKVYLAEHTGLVVATVLGGQKPHDLLVGVGEPTQVIAHAGSNWTLQGIVRRGERWVVRVPDSPFLSLFCVFTPLF